jgi:hypothetical protein
VTPDLDTLLIALYVDIDDHVISAGRPGCGHPRKLSDAELVCLAVAQVLLGSRSEHHWLRICYGRLGDLLPYLPKKPGYRKRLKAAAPLLAAAIDQLARQCPSRYEPVRLIRPDRRDEAPHAYTRIAKRLLAMAVCIWHDWSTSTPVTRSLIAYNH